MLALPEIFVDTIRFVPAFNSRIRAIKFSNNYESRFTEVKEKLDTLCGLLTSLT